MNYSYYVDTLDGIQKSLEHWMLDLDGELFPVIEPILMSQAEFDNLPEFEGY